MTTNSADVDSGSNGGVALVLIALVIIVVVCVNLTGSSKENSEAMALASYESVVAEFSLQHAIARHGEAAVDAVKQCIDGGFAATMINPITGRQAKICKIGNKFWITIFEAVGDLVTSFPNKGKIIDDVIKYLANVGYQ